MNYRPPNWLNRFWKKVDIKKPNDCWPWTGWKKHGPKGGYGLIRFNGPPVKSGSFKDYRAPRLAWEIAHGATPLSDLLVCHTCDNPACVNWREVTYPNLVSKGYYEQRKYRAPNH